MTQTGTTEKSYFQAHILKDTSVSLEGPELHADFAVENARIGLVNFMKDLRERIPAGRRMDDARIQQYASMAIALEALRQCRNTNATAYAGLIYDVSEMHEELQRRREAELKAARWQKWAFFFGQLAASAVAVLAIIVLV